MVPEALRAWNFAVGFEKAEVDNPKSQTVNPNPKISAEALE